MSAITITEAKQGKAGPYSGSVKVKVVVCNGPKTYQSNGVDKQSLTVGLADQSGSAKGIIYDPQQFSRYKTGDVVAIKNFIVRADKTLVVTRNSKSFKSGGMNVPDIHVSSAERLVNPPPAPFISLEQTKASPVKTVVSVRGQIVQEDQEREVMCSQTPTRVKDIYLGDSKTRIKLTLWRDLCDMPHRPGDFIEVTDVLTQIYKGEFSLSMTPISKVQASEAPLEQKLITVEGIGGTAEEMELLLDDGETVTIQAQLLQGIFPDDPEKEIAENAPLKLKILQRGATVENVVRV